METTWIHSNANHSLPAYAVVGGHDSDGTPIYVGRALHDGDLLPAKVIPSKRAGYVAYGGSEHTKSSYEVLVGQGYTWAPCGHGAVPPNAVRSGMTRTGEPLYVGRGHHANSLTVGKIHPSHGCLYIPYGGQEVRVSTYEVLVHQIQNWTVGRSGCTPPEAVLGGHRAEDRAPIYVARALHEGQMLPAKFIPSRGGAYVCYRGKEYSKQHFDVLCGYGYTWVSPHHNCVPANAVTTGRTRRGEPMYIGRGHYEGSITPGFVSPKNHCLYIAYFGREVRLDNFEVLCQ